MDIELEPGSSKGQSVSPKSPKNTAALQKMADVDTTAMTTEEYWSLAAASNAQLKQELMNVHKMSAPALLELLEDDNPRTALLEKVVEFRQKSDAAAASLPSRRAQDLPDVVENVHTAQLQKNLSAAVNVRDQALAQVMELKRDLEHDKRHTDVEHMHQEQTGVDKVLAVCQKYSVPLFAGVVTGMVMANAAPETYATIFKTELLSPDIRPFDHKVDLAFIVNDCLMAIHFGLALQEICVATLPGGAMNPIKTALNPVIATLGGLLGPIGLYFLVSVLFDAGELYGNIPVEDYATCGIEVDLTAGGHRRQLEGAAAAPIDTNSTYAGDEPYPWHVISNGWGIVTATDIPLAWVSAEIIFGMGHPAISYLLLLAVADDLMGVIIIAAFYPNPHHPFQPAWLLLVVLGMAVAYLMRRMWVQSWTLYLLGPGVLCWFGLLGSAIHPALCFCPIIPFMPATLKPTAEPGSEAKTRTREERQLSMSNDTPHDVLKEMAARIAAALGVKDDATLTAAQLAQAVALLKDFSADRAFEKIEQACGPDAGDQGKPASQTAAGLAALWKAEHLAHFSQDVFPKNNIFQGMDEDHKRQFGEAIIGTGLSADALETFKTDEHIFDQGEAATCMYVLARGHVRFVQDNRVLKDDDDNSKVTTADESLFGELGLVTHSPRPFSVVASDEVHCWKISFDTLVGFPDVVDSLHKMQDIYDEELAKMEAEEHGFHESALHGVEHGLKRFMVFVVLFLFTWANAGVKIEDAPGALAFKILISLFLGKFIGIVAMGKLAERFIAPFPKGVTSRELIVTGCIAAIGMTIALFISVEAFGDCPTLMKDAKLGSLFSLLGFPIAFGVGIALKVHNGDSALAHATEMHDMDDILYDEVHKDVKAEALKLAAKSMSVKNLQPAREPDPTAATPQP